MDFEIRGNRKPGGGRLVRERAAYFELMEQGYSTRDAARIVGINLRTGKRWRNGWHSAEVSRLLGYEPAPDPDKSVGRPADGHPESLDVFGLDAVTVRGTYRCPGGRCGRRAGADEDGREPRCVIDEAPMVFRSL
ncbi:helix-turn-helix domain-containing protein [Streptomyces sp. NBC_01363]|uniref:helix-turn-helix domain-containing protein n=1 Tax=Streptomyces sp. NBC_01363 TaxID=2903840 RepID=UPI00225BE26B|nr:helix-turn-helix domain-containing protein [Streptomyces sp. NBC_01363]MCX4729473.1 helix-turn-helix domain-containing protein [Streptomyces sp. NBC_01363]MCX4736881.1 helix-turn-helix domain-containing protein [Streptomyces sp. NBC_01363]